MRKRTILVTGASGFIGEALVPHLLKEGYIVRALVREGKRQPITPHPRLEHVVGDVRDQACVLQAMQGVDAIVHLAARLRDEPDSEEVNVGGTQNIADAAVLAGVKRIVNVSTQSVKLTRKGPYGETKAQAEEILARSGIPTVTFRPSLVYASELRGALGTIAQYARLPLVPIIGSGNVHFQPIHRDDLARVIAIALKEDQVIGNTYDVGGPDRVSFRELITLFAENAGKRPRMLFLPTSLCLFLARLCSFLKHPPLTLSNVLGAMEDLPMDIAAFARDFGFTPRSLRDGLRDVQSSQREKKLMNEARALLRYLASPFDRTWAPPEALLSRYREALSAHRMGEAPLLASSLLRLPVLLAGLDALSCFRKQHLLQRKLLIAAALLESHPASAPWFLPCNRTRGSLIGRTVLIMVRTLGAWCLALPTLCVPFLASRETSVQHSEYRPTASIHKVSKKKSIGEAESADVIVVGSGPAGMHAARPLVAAGLRTLMLDGGFTGPPILEELPARTFEDLRKSREDQYRWFLGEDLSSIPVEGLRGGLGGGMVSGNRSYVTQGTEELLPLLLTNTQVIQSLAQGGLAAAWGGTCAYLPEHELTAMGLPPEELQRHYDIVTEHIGISGPEVRSGIQRPLRPNHHAELLLRTFERRRNKARHLQNIHVQQPHAAVLTAAKGKRQPSTYTDMDYYADPGRSIYRPKETLEELRTHSHFQYRNRLVVEEVREERDAVIVFARTVTGRDRMTFRARHLILAAGAVNTARILLRSFGLYERDLPFVGKPHAFTACLHLRTLGSAGKDASCGLCQLLVLDTEKKSDGLERSCAQLYSYKSLQLFRLLPSLPLPVPEALDLLRLFTPSLIIADIRFPALPSPRNTLRLTRKEGRDTIHISMSVTDEETHMRQGALHRLHKAFRGLGLLPIRTMMLGEASSSHYAGTVPIAPPGTPHPLSCDEHCRLRQAGHISIADAAVFRALSAKPHTLTLMANAHRVGEEVARLLQSNAQGRAQRTGKRETPFVGALL